MLGMLFIEYIFARKTFDENSNFPIQLAKLRSDSTQMSTLIERIGFRKGKNAAEKAFVARTTLTHNFITSPKSNIGFIQFNSSCSEQYSVGKLLCNKPRSFYAIRYSVILATLFNDLN